MFRLIEAGIVAMLIDLAALVIVAPLLVLIEKISGCRRRRKTRPLGGVKVGHWAA